MMMQLLASVLGSVFWLSSASLASVSVQDNFHPYGSDGKSHRAFNAIRWSHDEPEVVWSRRGYFVRRGYKQPANGLAQ